MSGIDYAREYDNSGRVENAAALIDAYVGDAAEYRANPAGSAEYDREYGRKPRQKLDIFWPENYRDCPMVMFIHGGYWQRLDRSAFSHMAKGLNENGIAVALPSYTLAPENTVTGIMNEMRRACLLLHKMTKQHLTVVGHSAGGHLAACMMATDWENLHSDLPVDLVQSGLGISGLYDLKPLLETPINDALGMDEKEAATASPMRWLPPALQRFDAWVGSEESSEYHRQSRELASRWTMLGTPTAYTVVPDTNHFTVVDAMTDKNSPMVKRIVDLIENPRLEVDLPEPADLDLASPDASAEDQPEAHDEGEQQEAREVEEA